MKSKILFVSAVFLVSACNPWKNADYAYRVDVEELDGWCYTFYSQPMWDADLEFVTKTEYRPSRKIRSINGKLEVEDKKLIYRGAKTFPIHYKSNLKK